MRHVVTVADVGQANLFQIAEPLHQGEVVSQRLAGMFKVAQRIDYGNARMLRHSLDSAVRVRPQHNRVDPALHIVRDVAQFLARIKAARSLIHKKRVAAHARHPRFKCKPGTEGLLFEKHHHLLTR